MFADNSALGIGYGMTGNVRIEPNDAYLKQRGESREQYMKHCAVRFTYEKDSKSGAFYYHDIRRFGFIHYLSEKELKNKLSELGPSILDEIMLSCTDLAKIWRRGNNKNICVLLLNHQEYISGIGNYLKAEALYRCGVHPLALTRDIPDDILYNIYCTVSQLARAAYLAGGASLYTFTGLDGDRSEFKNELLVYNRSRDPLGHKVLKMETPDKRTTHWVPTIQVIGAPEAARVTKSISTISKIKIRVKPKITNAVDVPE
jgi:formamidopyrimidine-DNA glycosylase